MNRNLPIIALISALTLFSPAANAQDLPKADDGAKQLTLADPFVFEENGCYYIYGTSSNDGILVFKSKDLKHWQGPCGLAQGGHALHKNDCWGEFFFWAPEVYKIGGRYAMVYSAQEHLAVAFADSPLGPFRAEDGPGAYNPEREGIDGHVFTDEDGRKYIYWVRFDRGLGNEIWCSRISADLTTLEGEQVPCIQTQKDTWEQTRENERVAEGPFVVKHKGLYYLSYSCNDFRNPEYAVGYAVSENPMGPWHRFEGNPILRHKKEEDGTGHHMLLTTSKGKRYIVYHAHLTPGTVSPRKTFIAPYRFRRSASGDIINISKKVIVPFYTE